MKQNSKTVLMNASGSTSGAGSSLTASVDTKGFGYARILCLVNGTSALHTTVTNNALEEGDDTSTFSAVTAAAPGTGWTVSTATSVTTLAKLAYNVDLRGRKRYLKVTLGLATSAATAIVITADLSNPGDGCGTASEQGAAVSVQI
jgi:hypothetical protein